MSEMSTPRRQLKIFRASEAHSLDNDTMAPAGITPAIGAGLQKTAEAGVGEGVVIRHLFGDPVSGLSLVYAWLKSGFQLPVHSHDADCAYYVISGEAILGTDVLKAGDGFFVPNGVRYSYRAGADGVEVMEFRNVTRFNIDFTGSGPSMFDRIAEVSRANADVWKSQIPPLAVQRFGAGKEWI
jgi:quercetin dioxygenase-like cupin family protein